MTRRRSPSSPIPAREPSDAPPDLRCTDLFLGDERFVVLSFASPPKSQLPGLSPAESAVVRGASVGLTTAEIAAHRGSSVFTIQNQLTSAYRKLGISSRAELSALLARFEPHET